LRDVLLAQRSLEADEKAAIEVRALQRGDIDVARADGGQSFQSLFDRRRIQLFRRLVSNRRRCLPLESQSECPQREDARGVRPVHFQVLGLTVADLCQIRIGHQDVHVSRKNAGGKSLGRASGVRALLKSNVLDVGPQLERLAHRDRGERVAAGVRGCQAKPDHVARGHFAFAPVDRVDHAERVQRSQRSVAGDIGVVWDIRHVRQCLSRRDQFATATVVQFVYDVQHIGGGDFQTVVHVLRPEAVVEGIRSQQRPLFEPLGLQISALCPDMTILCLLSLVATVRTAACLNHC